MNFMSKLISKVIKTDTRPNQDELKDILERVGDGDEIPVEDIVRVIKPKDVSFIIMVDSPKSLEDTVLKESFLELVDDITDRITKVSKSTVVTFSFAAFFKSEEDDKYTLKLLGDGENEPECSKMKYVDLGLSVTSTGDHIVSRCVYLPSEVKFK